MTRGYSNEEIMAMQRDAIRRVNEMRRISEEKLRQSAAAQPEKAVTPEQHKPPEKPEESPEKPDGDSSGGLGALLQTIAGDHETLLLLALLLLLIREGADTPLILALVYVLL